MSTPPANPAPCPPHHWQVEEHAGRQHWTCYRCGAQRDQAVRDVEQAGPRWGQGAKQRRRPPPP